MHRHYPEAAPKPPTFDPWQAYVVAAEVSMATQASAESLAALGAQRLAALLASAAANSPRYRRLLAGCDPATVRLEDLPVSHKAQLMTDFEGWVADPALSLQTLRGFVADPAKIAMAFMGRYTVWESSGSTGEPAIFVQDAHAMAVYDALEALRRPLLRPLDRLLDPWSLTERIAFVGATEGHFASTVSVERLRRLQPGLSQRLRGISFLQPLDRLCAELDAFAPTVVATYPSAAVLLAQERRAGRLEAAPREVWTGGETLSAAGRAFVRSAFGCPVANSYGASEFLSLAFECPLGVLHLNSDWAILEPVDAHGRAVPRGHAGTTTLLTNLANHLQPLIRYDLGDRVTLRDADCQCGSHLPALDVQGRDDDTLRLDGAHGMPSVKVLPLAVTTVLEEEAGLFDFQLVQQGPRELLLKSCAKDAQAAQTLRKGREVLGAFLEAQGARGIRIHCRSGEGAHCGRSGKTRRVISL
ncbi:MULTISPECIES: phenylacetate--CoA ligase family protein [unclassified Variovorax]|uniref:phenylacetate--CoA ligase family protein n=1 Tax=unclassified Variovorax TaxID=663243 RepID=UPI000D21536B|nr:MULTISPECIES: phenylacetate--CoA ligase family protein [unclassified Variovorax]AVQ85627.1 CoF synthetase [Variovorax sp. PMC12]QRY35257.1 phenylacetate--CoA ligase family protein [Variovorax sp. PDNC026]